MTLRILQNQIQIFMQMLTQLLGMELTLIIQYGLGLEELGMRHSAITSKSIFIEIKNPHSSEGFFMGQTQGL